jgi:hypothetical protein
MSTLRRLSDGELDQLFGRFCRVELCEEDILALLRGDPRDALRRVGLGRSARTVMEACAGMDRCCEPGPIVVTLSIVVSFRRNPLP